MIRRLASAFVLASLLACSRNHDAPPTGTAARIVTLAPNLAELVYAVGAGEQLVGVSAWSDYPRVVRNNFV